MSFFDDVRSAYRRQGAPVTMGIIVALVALSVFFLLTEYRYAELVAFYPGWIGRPWTVLTYPFLYQVVGGFGVIGLIFTVMWLLWIGGTIEREQGVRRYLAIWVLFTVLPALCLTIGWSVTRATEPILGPWLPLSALTVIWGFRHPTATIRLFAILPITGFWLALLSVVIVFVDYAHPPLLGVFACLPLLLAYLFATDRLPGLRYAVAVAQYQPSKAQQEKERRYFDDVRKREQERAERERLRKLFEKSFDEDGGGEGSKGDIGS